MQEEAATKNGGLDAEIKSRVPKKVVEAIDADVAKRREKFPRASRADVIRDSLTEYFQNHPVQAELQLAAGGNGR